MPDTASRLAGATDAIRSESSWLKTQAERVSSEMDRVEPIMREARLRIRDLEYALKHARSCQVCADGDWTDCEHGAEALKLLSENDN